MKVMRCARRVPRSLHPLWVVGAVLLALGGCAKPSLRAQAEDDVEQLKYSVETLNQWAMFDNVDPLSVFGDSRTSCALIVLTSAAAFSIVAPAVRRAKTLR